MTGRSAAIRPVSGLRGQALVEALVVLLALVPLLLAMPLLARFQDIRIAAVSASRSAAFDCTVRFEQCVDPAATGAMADDLRRRHFGAHRRDLLSDDAMPALPAASERNGFWVDRRGQPLLVSMHDVALQVQPGQVDALTRAWSRGLPVTDGGADQVLAAMSDVAGPGAFGLSVGGGLFTARVRARIGEGKTVADWLRRPEGLALALTGKTAVVADAWNATSADGDGERTVLARVEQGRRLPTLGEGMALLRAATGFGPSGTFAALDRLEPEDAIDAAYRPVRELITGPLLAPVEPRGRLFRYHEVDSDLVPPDRIGGRP